MVTIKMVAYLDGFIPAVVILHHAFPLQTHIAITTLLAQHSAAGAWQLYSNNNSQ